MTAMEAATETRRCPRCGEPLPANAYYEPLANHATEREGAYIVRHPKEGGGLCEGVAGPPRQHEEIEALAQ